MALNDLTGQNIQDTFQKVVQTDGTNLADGTGSLLPISIDGNNVTISGSLTANEYIVSSSVTNITIVTLSGSTDFGDDTGDTHKFTGSLFISGATVGINNDNPNYMLDVGGDIHTTNALRSSGLYSSFGTFTSNINANGNIVGDNGTNISGINTFNCIGNATLGNTSTDAHTVNGTLTANNKISTSTVVEAPTGSFKKLKGDTTLATGLFIDGTITASGNISSSGTVIGLSGSFSHILGNSPITVQDQITFQSPITASGNISSSGTLQAFKVKVNDLDAIYENYGAYRFGQTLVPIYTGHITSSGNISASGNFEGSEATIHGALTTPRINGVNSEVYIADNIKSTNITASGYVSASGTGSFTGGIIAGGNISQSNGILYTNHIELVGNNIFHGGDIGLPIQANHVQITNPNDGPIAAANVHSRLLVDGDITANTHITASGNISSSGHTIANYFDAKVSGTGYKLSGAKILYIDGSIYKVGRAPSKISITGSNITLDGPVTASGNISSSATIIGNIISGSTISGSFVGDGSSLTSIPSPFTAAAISGSLNATTVAAAGALMDTEVTNLAEVKAFSAADYATSAQGTTADSAVQPADTFFIGTTSVAHNRSSAALTLAGITLTTPDIGTPSGGDLSNCTFPTLNQSTTGTSATVTGTTQASITTCANLTTIGTVTTGDVSAILPSGTVSSSAQVSQPIIIGQFGNYATAVQGPNADYHFGHDQGIHAGIWSNTTTDPSVISAEYQHIGIVAPYDMKNVCAKVAVRGQSGADPAFWIYTGSFLENNNGNTNLGWAASSSSANYNGHSTIQGNRTNAMFSCNITGSDSFNLKENDLMMFYITNQENNSKSIRIMATIYGEKE